MLYIVVVIKIIIMTTGIILCQIKYSMTDLLRSETIITVLVQQKTFIRPWVV